MGFYKVLKERTGAKIKIINLKKSSENGELVGSIVAKNSKLKPFNCPKEIIASLIDELPILFIICALTNGTSKFQNINEVTKKESNRIREIAKILVQIGIRYKSTNDSMIIYGNSKIKNKNKTILVNTESDHRICMSSVILSLVTGIKTKINNFETVNTSFPGFIRLLRELGGKIEIK